MELLVVILETAEDKTTACQHSRSIDNYESAYHVPRQRSRLARMDPKMAALITCTLESPLDVPIKTMNRMISTMEPNVVSRTTAKALLGILRENSWPAKPSKFAEGNIAM